MEDETDERAGLRYDQITSYKRVRTDGPWGKSETGSRGKYAMSSWGGRRKMGTIDWSSDLGEEQ